VAFRRLDYKKKAIGGHGECAYIQASFGRLKGGSMIFFRHVMLCARRFLAAAVLLALPARAPAVTLYATEFEEFAVGADRWVGTNGWQGTSAGVGIHGIDQDQIPGLGKTAFLGFKRPKSTFVTVFRAALYNPATNQCPNLQFESLLGIEDSTNGRRDSFFISFYNIAGYLLASIRFDNVDASYGIWRLDASQQVDTGMDFIRSELHLLNTDIDLFNNVWSADLDGIPLFTGATFNATGVDRDLGFVAAEWQLSSSSTNQYGDNWMLVADWAVRAIPSSLPFQIDFAGISNGAVSLGWTGTYGFSYAVENADSSFSWQAVTNGGVFTNITTSVPLAYTSAAESSNRQFRVRRYLSP
jgi:hypothetical protein